MPLEGFLKGRKHGLIYGKTLETPRKLTFLKDRDPAPSDVKAQGHIACGSKTERDFAI